MIYIDKYVGYTIEDFYKADLLDMEAEADWFNFTEEEREYLEEEFKWENILSLWDVNNFITSKAWDLLEEFHEEEVDEIW